MPKDLVPKDLGRVWFRTPDAQTVSALSATDEQFDKWIRTRMEVLGNGSVWSYSERLEVCNMLWQANALYMTPEEDP